MREWVAIEKESGMDNRMDNRSEEDVEAESFLFGIDMERVTDPILCLDFARHSFFLSLREDFVVKFREECVAFKVGIDSG